MLRADIHDPTKLLRSLIKPDLKFVISARLRQRIVVCRGPGVEISELDPAAGTKIFVGLAKEGWPVSNAAAHCAELDEVKGLGVRVEPWGFAVVDLEL